MNKISWLLLIVKLIADIFFILFSFILAYIIRFQFFQIGYLPLVPYFRFSLFVVILWLLIFNLMGLYKPQKDLSVRGDSPLSIALAVTIAAITAYLVVMLIYKEAFYSYLIILYAWAIGIILINLSRYIIWKIQSKFMGY